MLKDILTESLKTEKWRKQRLKKTEQNIQGPWDNYKKCNICIMETPKEEERDKKTEEIFETIMTKNFPQLMSDTKPQI